MAPLKQLRGTAFVSGASTGLGDAFARMLLSEGVQVWGTSRDLSRLSELGALHPGTFHAVELDLADGPGALRAFGAAAAAAGGSFDIVVNNAGFGVFGEFDALESSAWRAQVEGALLTVLELSHSAYRLMRARDRGCLVHISSLAAEFPLPYMSGYNVVKAGLSALSESLMFESRRSGITIIDFRPGDYRTNFNRAMQKDSVSDATRKVWGRLDAMLAAAPAPERAASDLRRALIANRSGVVRSGSLFQAGVAPLLARLLPASWVRGANALYFGA
jgi:short-subunit dehydrogenase